MKEKERSKKIYEVGHIIAKISEYYGFLNHKEYKNFCKKEISENLVDAIIHNQKEEWASVPGYKNLYEVSDVGRVKSKRKNREKILRPGINRTGYYFVILSKNGVKKHFTVHKLVWISFKGKIGRGLEVDHKNGIKTDSRLSNLQLLSRTSNVRKAVSQNKNDIKKFIKMLGEL